MKTKREPIPQTEVLAWLQEHHPNLHATAEIDRAWIWVTENLSHPDNKPIRESIGENGFVFARRLHPLPSGRLGTWGHSCLKPMPFKRNGKGSSKAPSRGASQPKHQAEAERHDPLSVEREPAMAHVELEPDVLAWLES